MATFTLNDQKQRIDAEADMPLLWLLREQAGLTGTKYGCGIAQCGACTVLLDGEAVRACSIPASALKNRSVTTIEGLNTPVGRAVQEAWISLDVAQCGYCQSGQIMSAVALLEGNSKPTDADIDNAMGGNICRCATYQRIRAAIHAAAISLAA